MTLGIKTRRNKSKKKQCSARFRAAAAEYISEKNKNYKAVIIMPVHKIENSVTSSRLTVLRDIKTGSFDFRRNIAELSFIMAYEAGKKLPVKEVTTKSVLEDTNSVLISAQISVIPILRAGLGMVEGFLNLFPEAIIAPLGLSRDHETLQPNFYYANIPQKAAKGKCFILDPMLATGGTACFAIQYMIDFGVDISDISLFSILASPEGIDKVSQAFPCIDIYTVAIDRCLNKSGYILPGLGDAGDRLFSTAD